MFGGIKTFLSKISRSSNCEQGIGGSLPIKLVVGLGNKGAEYVCTRHNIGFLMADSILKKYCGAWIFDKKWNAEKASICINGAKVFVLKPMTFMNRSGDCVQRAKNFLKIKNEQILVVCDDISMQFGLTKVSTTTGSAGHNGVSDICKKIGDGFVRYRIGIGSKPHKEMLLSDFVLSKLTPNEIVEMDTVAEKFCKNAEVIIDKGVIKGMNYIER